jgi:hypothetical protein
MPTNCFIEFITKCETTTWQMMARLTESQILERLDLYEEEEEDLPSSSSKYFMIRFGGLCVNLQKQPVFVMDLDKQKISMDFKVSPNLLKNPSR